jgi:hypothetical protein
MPPGGGVQSRPVILGEGQGGRQGVDRVALGPPGGAAFQIADGPDADGGGHGELLLRHPAGGAQLGKQLGEVHGTRPSRHRDP